MTEGSEQIQAWRAKLAWYRETYSGMYGKQPSEKLVVSFCKIYNIPWPIPKKTEFDFLE